MDKRELARMATAHIVGQLKQRGWSPTPGSSGGIKVVVAERNSSSVEIYVRTKQQRAWPSCRGVPHGALLILVDYDVDAPVDVPEIFILTRQDWDEVIEKFLTAYHGKYPTRSTTVEDGCPIFPEQLQKDGRPYRGHSVTRPEVEIYRDQWHKLDACITSSPE